jgi:site-specific DNA recombinase
LKDSSGKDVLRCAIYTRVSTDQGLEQEFNSPDAQREASEAYIKSQAHEGWRLMRDRYDDGGYSGGSIGRPALQKLLADVQVRRIDIIVVYKVLRARRESMAAPDFLSTLRYADGLAAFCPATISSSLRSTVTSRCQCKQ